LFLVFLMLRWSFLDLRSWLRARFAVQRTESLEEMVLQVDGMTCANCAAHIKRDLESVPGVARVDVNLERGLARLWGRALNRERLSQTVCRAGYTVRGTVCS
jgi:copper chaperone CopZ